MGLGKTLQGISFLLLNKNKRKISLVVTETSLIYNWESEFKKFAPSLEVGCAYGSKDKDVYKRPRQDYPMKNVGVKKYQFLKNLWKRYQVI